MFNNSSDKKKYHQISSDDFDDDAEAPSSRISAQQLMQHQDAGLELLSQSAQRLGQMSQVISDELHQQNQMLDELDDDLDAADENLDFVTKQTKAFIKLSGGTQNCVVIASLTGIVIVLILLIVYW